MSELPVPPPAPAAVPTAWVRNTVLFLTGQTVSLLGSSLVQYAVLWHLTLQSRSGLVLTAAMVAGFLPQAVMSVFGGVWADRHNRKWLLIGADATIAAATLVLALVLITGFEGLWPVYLILAIRSLGAGVQMPAVGALLPQIVPTDQLVRVNGINTALQSSLTLLAPALAAAIYAALELQAVLLVDVSTAVIGIALVAVIPVATLPSADTRAGYFADVIEGLRYARADAVIRRVLVVYTIVFVLAAPASFLTPLLIVRTFGDEIWMLTANELAFGIGMLSGGAVIAFTGKGHDRLRMLLGGSLGFAVASIAMGLAGDIAGSRGNLWIYLVFIGGCGVAVAYFATAATTALQEQSDPALLGRVFGLVGIVAAVAMPVGMAVFGPLADVLSVEWILIITGALTVLATVAAGYRAPKAPAPPAGPADPGAAPAAADAAKAAE